MEDNFITCVVPYMSLKVLFLLHNAPSSIVRTANAEIRPLVKCLQEVKNNGKLVYR